MKHYPGTLGSQSVTGDMDVRLWEAVKLDTTGRSFKNSFSSSPGQVKLSRDQDRSHLEYTYRNPTPACNSNKQLTCFLPNRAQHHFRESRLRTFAHSSLTDNSCRRFSKARGGLESVSTSSGFGHVTVTPPESYTVDNVSPCSTVRSIWGA